MINPQRMEKPDGYAAANAVRSYPFFPKVSEIAKRLHAAALVPNLNTI